jgi:predicted GNAT superfamily acetyltransferase
MPTDITVRLLHSLEDFQKCVQIAREVWGDTDLDTEPTTTLVIAHHTGGQILGAFDGDTMIGFTKAYVGLHDHTPYLHSHMAAVLASHRDRRVGRQLKLFQREDALRRGIRLIEWTFDPLETKNAHFNINRLGAITRRYIPNFYGITTSPLHRGMPTDRLLAEWYLDSPRVIAAVNELNPEPRNCPATIHLPNSVIAPPAVQTASANAGTHSSSQGPPVAPDEGTPDGSALIELQFRIRTEFTSWFAKGYAATGVRTTLSGVDYCLSPYSDF